MSLRAFISIVLMFLMLTPSMVCFMAMSSMPVHASMGKSPPPCHEQKSHSTPPVGPMLMEDCMGTDLAQASNADAPLPAIAWILVPFILPLSALPVPLVAGMRTYGSDPPPTRRASFHRILITQRILQ